MHSIRLPDGRQLAYEDLGDPSGVPMLFSHGLPSSRLAAVWFEDAATRAGVRLIAPDRPGWGYSDPLEGREIIDWPADALALADSLGIEHFHAIGLSSGFPYAAATAIAAAERVLSIIAISPASQLDEPGVLDAMALTPRTIYRIGLRSRRLGRLWLRALGRVPARTMAHRQVAEYSEVDREVLADGAVFELRVNDLEQAMRQGSDALVLEGMAHLEDWGFTLADVRTPTRIWCGTDDYTHGSEMSAVIERRMPCAVRTLVPNAGFMWSHTHFDDIAADAIAGLPLNTERSHVE